MRSARGQEGLRTVQSDVTDRHLLRCSRRAAEVLEWAVLQKSCGLAGRGPARRPELSMLDPIE